MTGDLRSLHCDLLDTLNKRAELGCVVTVSFVVCLVTPVGAGVRPDLHLRVRTRRSLVHRTTGAVHDGTQVELRHLAQYLSRRESVHDGLGLSIVGIDVPGG